MHLGETFYKVVRLPFRNHEQTGQTPHDVGGGSEAYLGRDEGALGGAEEGTEINGLRHRLVPVR